MGIFERIEQKAGIDHRASYIHDKIEHDKMLKQLDEARMLTMEHFKKLYEDACNYEAVSLAAKANELNERECRFMLERELIVSVLRDLGAKSTADLIDKRFATFKEYMLKKG